MDVGAARLVVERDVPADDRDAERLARLAHALDDLGELPHHLGVLRVPEVEAVHERERARPCRRDVARRFEDDEPAAGARVELAEARLAVGRERERLRRALDAQHRGVGAGTGDRVQEQLVVVLARDPRLVGDRRRRERARAAPGRGRRRARTSRAAWDAGSSAWSASWRGRARDGPAVRAARRRGCRPARRRSVRGRSSTSVRVSPSGGGGFSPGTPIASNKPSNTRKRPVSVTRPTTVARISQRRASSSTASRFAGSTIASMRSWLSDVSTSTAFMPGLALGDARDVDVHADATLRRGLRRRAREAGRAEVLHADRELAVEQLEARLDQPLLLERVADLHRRALRLAAFFEARRREHARAADAVAAGRRAEQHREVAGAFGARRARAAPWAGCRGTAR